MICTTLESGRTSIFIFDKCTAPNLSLKIRYSCLGTPVICIPLACFNWFCVRTLFTYHFQDFVTIFVVGYFFSLQLFSSQVSSYFDPNGFLPEFFFQRGGQNLLLCKFSFVLGPNFREGKSL